VPLRTRECTYPDDSSDELSEGLDVNEKAGGDALQGLLGREGEEVLDFLDRSCKDLLDFFKDRFQNFDGALDGLKVG